MKLGNGRKLIRKSAGHLADWKRETAELRIPLVPLSYLESEFILDAELQDILQEHKDKQND